jgi:hypothetical protein
MGCSSHEIGGQSQVGDPRENISTAASSTRLLATFLNTPPNIAAVYACKEVAGAERCRSVHCRDFKLLDLKSCRTLGTLLRHPF